MKTNNYNVERIIDSLYNKGYTNFLNPKDLALVKGKLNKNEYKVYELYTGSNKVILYRKDKPIIKLYKIVTNGSLRHQDILGSIFSLGIKEDTFGDIIKLDEEFYIFLLPHLEDYFKFNLLEIRNNKVELVPVDIGISNNFKQEFVIKEYIVTSLRLDNVVSTITNESRNQVLDKFKNKDVILNNDDNIKSTRVLRESDVFSIRKYGKYKFSRVLKETKKGGFIVELLMYK